MSQRSRQSQISKEDLDIHRHSLIVLSKMFVSSSSFIKGGENDLCRMNRIRPGGMNSSAQKNRCFLTYFVRKILQTIIIQNETSQPL